MSTTIVMPQLGESVAEGIIGKWLKRQGDQIEKDEPLVEVITDKVNAEIPSPVAGVLRRITQPEGATVLIGQEIALIGDGSPEEDQGADGVGSAAEEVVTQRVAPVPTEVERVGPAGQSMQSQITEATVSAASRPQPAGSNGRGDRVRSSPLVRRLAEQSGIDLAEVPGTGIGGRVSKQDILSYVEQREEQESIQPESPQVTGAGLAVADRPAVQPPPSTEPATPSASPGSVAPTAAPPGASSVPAQPPRPPQPSIAREAGPREELVPVSPLRKMIAGRMVQSKLAIPHATTQMEVDMSNVVRFRNAHKDDFQNREGVSLSYVAFVIKVTVEALKEYPMVNAEWAGDNIIMKHDVNINVAVDAPEGLTTPVIHHADDRSLAGLSKAIVDLSTRARNKKLTVADMQGGTFTVNNTGSLGSVGSVSIINYPQAGILTANAIVKRPVVLEQDGEDVIAVRSMMNLSFSFDHRLLDGGTATGFVNAVKGKLQSWSLDYPIY